MTYDQAVLMKRMAWNNIRLYEQRQKDRLKPQPSDDICAVKARRGIELVACLNYGALELEEELTAAGMFRHETKRIVREIQKITARVHQQAWNMLDAYKAGVGKVYNNRMYAVWQKIDEAVLLTPPERAYNIVLSLVRFIANINAELKPYRWDFFYTRDLQPIIPKLSRIAIADRNIDAIIDMATR